MSCEWCAFSGSFLLLCLYPKPQPLMMLLNVIRVVIDAAALRVVRGACGVVLWFARAVGGGLLTQKKNVHPPSQKKQKQPTPHAHLFVSTCSS